MLKFLLQRIVQGIVVMLVVAFVAFCIFRFLGDPVNNMVGDSATEEEKEQIRQQLGLDEPVAMQYLKFVSNIAQGEFGTSYRTRTSVIEQMKERLPATLELSFISGMLSILLGIPMGIYSALHPKSWLSKQFLVGSLMGISIPTFLTGLLLIYLFSVVLGWFPSQGRGGLVELGWWTTSLLTVKGWSYIILPALTLCIYQMTLITRMVRAEMIEVMRTDYIKFAKARGLPDRIVQYRHGLKNSLVPVITIIGLQLGSVVAFSIITETVFNWPGLGQMFIQSIEFVDIPVMSAYLIFVGAFFVILNLLVDIAYAFIDPRLRVH